MSLYPGTDWRIELGALGQASGGGGGSRGRGASLMVSYSVTTWMDATDGFLALSSSRVENDTGLRGRNTRTFDSTSCGPIVGVGFSF